MRPRLGPRGGGVQDNGWPEYFNNWSVLPYFGFSDLWVTLQPFVSKPLLPRLVPQKQTCIQKFSYRSLMVEPTTKETKTAEYNTNNHQKIQKENKRSSIKNGCRASNFTVHLLYRCIYSFKRGQQEHHPGQKLLQDRRTRVVSQGISNVKRWLQTLRQLDYAAMN